MEREKWMQLRHVTGEIKYYQGKAARSAADGRSVAGIHAKVSDLAREVAFSSSDGKTALKYLKIARREASMAGGMGAGAFRELDLYLKVESVFRNRSPEVQRKDLALFRSAADPKLAANEEKAWKMLGRPPDSSTIAEAVPKRIACWNEACETYEYAARVRLPMAELMNKNDAFEVIHEAVAILWSLNIAQSLRLLENRWVPAGWKNDLRRDGDMAMGYNAGFYVKTNAKGYIEIGAVAFFEKESFREAASFIDKVADKLEEFYSMKEGRSRPKARLNATAGAQTA